MYQSAYIEWSPDHWWVTTNVHFCLLWQLLLNGHQIIGELRLHKPELNRQVMDWMVTRSLVSYDSLPKIQRTPRILNGPRSLVSYDSWTYCLFCSDKIEWSPDHWWVTTLLQFWQHGSAIEWSPDHWWVTTKVFHFYLCVFWLNGHQIIGELHL